MIIYLLVWLIRGTASERNGGGGKSAVEILDERYARDEIGEQEYQEKRRALS